MTYLTPDMRLQAAADRANHFNTMSLADMQFLLEHAARPSWDEPRREAATSTAFGEILNAHPAAHYLIHCGQVTSCCTEYHDKVKPAGPLAYLCYDVLTATEMPDLTALVTPEGYWSKLPQIRDALQWAAISAAITGYGPTLDNAWDLVRTFTGHGLSSAQLDTVTRMLPDWAGTPHELAMIMTAVTT